MKFEDGLVTGRNCRLEIEKIETLTKGEIRLTLGKNLQMNDFCHITAAEKVVIGDNVLIASKVYISDVSHGNYSGAMEHSSSSTLAVERPLISSPVTIEDNVWLGDGVCVLPGAYIGKNSIIGANAVVTGIIPPNCIAVGIPAKVVKIYNQQNKTWETIK